MSSSAGKWHDSTTRHPQTRSGELSGMHKPFYLFVGIIRTVKLKIQPTTQYVRFGTMLASSALQVSGMGQPLGGCRRIFAG